MPTSRRSGGTDSARAEGPVGPYGAWAPGLPPPGRREPPTPPLEPRASTGAAR